MFSKFFIDRPRFAVVIAIVMSLAGLIAIFPLPVACWRLRCCRFRNIRKLRRRRFLLRLTILVQVRKRWPIPWLFRLKRKLTVLTI